ncbi:heparin lyase I family protein [Betaproteobacteria bacterium LSUCC0117]|nr:heparin lyase I family protein [Betaproteobacteria bacterium LSUCC0117]
MNWRHATQNNISAPSTIWQTKKMPSQNNDLALLSIKHQYDNQCGIVVENSLLGKVFMTRKMYYQNLFFIITTFLLFVSNVCAGEKIPVPDSVPTVAHSPWNFIENFDKQANGEINLCRFFSNNNCMENLEINDKGAGFKPFQIKTDVNFNKYLEVTVKHGFSSDPYKKKGEETERVELQTTRKNALNKIIWIGFKIRVPKEFNHIDDRVLFFQFKNQFDKMKRSPLIGLRFYKNGDLFDISGETGGTANQSWNESEWLEHGIGVKYQKFDDNWIFRSEKNRGGREYPTQGRLSSLAAFPVYQRGEWVTYKIGIHNTKNEDGFVKVFQNDEMIFHYDGITYDWKGTYLGSYVRIGLYRDSGKGVEYPDQSIQFDNFAVVSDKETLDKLFDK